MRGFSGEPRLITLGIWKMVMEMDLKNGYQTTMENGYQLENGYQTTNFNGFGDSLFSATPCLWFCLQGFHLPG